MTSWTDLFRRSAIVCALLLAASACGAKSGGSDAASSTTEAPSESTAEPGSTTEPDSAGPDLSSVLLSASDLGEGWSISEDSEDSSTDEDPADAAIEEQCPDLAALGFDEDNEDEVSRSFMDDAGRQIDISLSPLGPDDSRDTDAIASALDACEVSFTDDGGTTTSISISAEPDGSRGDGGASAVATATIEDDSLPAPVELRFVLTLFVIDDDIGVTVTSYDGYDPTTNEVAPLDEALVGDVADELENRVNDLVDD